MARASAEILARYQGLEDITEDEWDEYFSNTDKPWTTSDLEYLVQWWGKDEILSLAYALGRPPWGLQRMICQLRARGRNIPYLRGEPRDVRVAEGGSDPVSTADRVLVHQAV